MKMEERNRRAASKWSALSMEEKKKFDDVAKKYRKPDISELSQDERERLVTRHRRQLLAEVMLLEDLGCHSALMF